MLVWTDSAPVVKPEVVVFSAHERFDGERPADEGTIDLVHALLAALRAKIEHTRLLTAPLVDAG